MAVTDADYQAQLATYRRDVAVVDSIALVARQDPLLKTDSIYKVYRLALRPRGASLADVQRLSCLERELTVRYGMGASSRVLGELTDTVFRDQGINDEKGAVNFFFDHAPASGVVDLGDCPPLTQIDRPLPGVPSPPLRNLPK
jgi:hypothetical protein